MRTAVVWSINVAAILAAIPGTLTATHLTLLGIASLFYREPVVAHVPRIRFLVVVPAHNEERALPASLAAIRRCLREDDTVLVVDDRSTDATACIARTAGAMVLQRRADEPPGRAAARQAAIDHAATLPWDALVMVDADSIVEPGFLDAAERALATGALALQARSEAARGGRLVDQAALASFALQGVLMPRGRDRLGALVRLRGSGMVLRREVTTRFSFHAAASEDLVYSLELCRAGIRIRHIDSARLRSQNAGSWRVASEQKLRYEVGRLAAAREHLAAMVQTRSIAGLEGAWFLASPPFAIAAASLVTGVGLALLAASMGASLLVPLVLSTAAALLAISLVVAAIEARLSPRIVVAMIAAPWYVGWKVGVQLRALLLARRPPAEFGATARRP